MNIEEQWVEEEDHERYASMKRAIDEDKPCLDEDEKERIIAEYMYLLSL